MKPIIAAEQVSAYDAKTHLPKLLERASRGERFVITRHGKPVAQLSPIEAGDDATDRETMARVTALHEQLEQRGVSLADVLDRGESARDLAHTVHRF